MLQKFLASVGIGAAKVDTILEKEKYFAGEEVRGIVHVKGGNVPQQVDSIYLTVFGSYIREVDDKKVTAVHALYKHRLTDRIDIVPAEEKTIPFSFLLPVDTPVTFGSGKVWIHTGLDISSSVDPTDKDFIEVLPNPLIAGVIQATEQLGFRLRQTECKEIPFRLRERIPFAQELEFIPVYGMFRGKLDELELLLFPRSNEELRIIMEIDRKARGLAGLFSEALDLDETHVQLVVKPADIPTLAEILQETISKYC
ncbi:sporulation protein [Ectobacillus sp. JY-23]|uniref:sporulation protein n=1 Tax=Ectobacillus sp. JY-23 TaxID=2933872 RepID=UPI001FF1150B|nr:sporulation protein [Ectobacillus sp. JY-23]UOY92946.1 sporulation protein [Ectobacillus sp. JY-23]